LGAAEPQQFGGVRLLAMRLLERLLNEPLLL
jgi:hypothetical protein